MTDLVACFTSGEKSLAHVQRLVKEHDWQNIFLITNHQGNDFLKFEKPVECVQIDSSKPVTELIEDIRKRLQNKISDLEVALNLVSGNGKEHMAILSALLKLGVGVRLVAVTKDGFKEL